MAFSAGAPPFPRSLGSLQLALAAVLVAAGYYAGVQIGLALTFVPATTSVLWPPNAILTVALVLVPVRQWWVCLAAALPVHFLLQIAAGMPPQLVAFLFVTNCTEAVLAAGGMRLLSDAPTEFNTFRRVAAFIAAAVLAAPVLSSFADATVVHLVKGDAFWTVWRARTFGNALTEMSVVPAAVRGVLAIAEGVRMPTARRLLETCLFAIGLLATAVWVFGERSTMPWMPPTPSVLLLPLYFWAAVRFGVGGVSAALFASAFVASYEASAGHRPFAVLPPIDSLIAVQLYLTVMGIPLMCMAGLLEERRRGAADLQERLRFEALLSTVSGGLVRQQDAAAFDDGLRHVGEYMHADYVGLLQVGSADGTLHVERQWNQPAAASLAGLTCVQEFPWAFARVLAGETLVCDSIEALPEDAVADRQAFVRHRIGSAVLVPLVEGTRVQGVLSLVTVGSGARIAGDLNQVQLVAELLANAGARRRAELDVQDARQRLAHMARASSMGELTAALAHQLNQPLAGILNNADAARRFIDSGQATVPQLREIVCDIIDDDRRAADVIRRVREMLTPTTWSPVRLDLNEIVRGVAVLTASDAVLRNVSVSFDVARSPLIVAGNRIDLEQVLLNVVTNAMEAVADRPVAQRLVNVHTARDHNGGALIVVRDWGAGLPDGEAQRIFEPFVTTKPAGMGMGLAVARTLVDHHGGSIRAVSHQDGGAVVTINLPAASEAVV